MIYRADKAALLPVQKIHSLAGIYTGVLCQFVKSNQARPGRAKDKYMSCALACGSISTLSFTLLFYV